MSDNPVAKRLRSFVDDTSSSGWIDARRLMLEAADEIERLERELAIERAMRLGVQTQTIEQEWRQQQKPWTECDHT